MSGETDMMMMMPPTGGGDGSESRGGGKAAAEEQEPAPPLVVAGEAVHAARLHLRGPGNVELEVVDSEEDEEEGEDSDGDNGDEVEAVDDDSEDSGDTEDEEDDEGEEGLADSVSILQEFNEMTPEQLRIMKMSVNMGHVPAMGGDPHRQISYLDEFPDLFRAFVTELGRFSDVLKIDLKFANFSQECWEGPEGREASQESSPGYAVELEHEFHVDAALQPDDRDLDRLFGTELPNDPGGIYASSAPSFSRFS